MRYKVTGTHPTRITRVTSMVTSRLPIRPQSIITSRVVPPYSLLLRTLARRLTRHLCTLNNRRLQLLLLRLHSSVTRRPRIHILVTICMTGLLHQTKRLPISKRVMRRRGTTMGVSTLRGVIYRRRTRRHKDILPLLGLIMTIPGRNITTRRVLIHFPLMRSIVTLRKKASNIRRVTMTL